MTDRQVTNPRGKMVPDSSSNQYIKFTTSSLEKDGGQTTLPFIELLNVTTKVATPLSGLGLYHKGSSVSKYFGGFLGIKLLTFDMTSHIEEYIY